MRCVFTTELIAALLFPAIVHADAPSVNALIPAGGRRGTTVEIKVDGKLGTAPVSVWCDRPGVTVTVPEKPDKSFSVAISEDAAPGICYLRVYNAEGAAALKPFVIGSLPEVAEKETNDRVSEPQRIDGSAVVNGVLSKNGDVDGYAFDLKSGQTLVASLAAHETLGSPMDGVLQLVSPEGFVLEQNDDSIGMDPQIVFTAPRDGTYLVRTFAFPATPNSSIRFSGGSNWVYRLTLTTGPFTDHVQPLAIRKGGRTPVEIVGWNLAEPKRELEPAAGAETVTVSDGLANVFSVPVVDSAVVTEPADDAVLATPVIVSGRIGAAGEVDSFRIQVKKGEALTIRADARSLGSPLDPVVRLVDGSGKELTEVDDPRRNEFDSVINFTPKEDGPVTVQIRDRFEHGGMRYFYRVSVTPPTVEYSLSTTADAFVLEPDKPLEVTVNVSRDKGFSAAIEVAAEGLPEGVTAEPVVSEGKGNSAKQVKLKLTGAAATAWQGPIRIVGKSKSDPPIVKPARATMSGLEATTPDLWLTVKAKK